MRGGAGVSVGQPANPRDRARELYDPAIVHLVEHRKIADLPDSARVYCLSRPIDYIGAGVVELKFRPGLAFGKYFGSGRVIGETMDAPVKRRFPGLVSDHVHNNPAPVETRPSREDA